MCSDVRKQMTEDRKQKSDSVLHPPIFIICLLSSDLCPLKTDTREMGLKKIKITAIMILFAVLCSACGYRFSEEGGFPGDTDRLFVKVLENRTQETGVENIVTAALLSELTLRKIDNLASGIDNADVVLSGVVEEVAIRTISTRKRDTAGERRVTVSVALKLTKPDGNVVWATKHLSDDEGYSVDANNERTDQNRRDAIRVLSRRIAEKVVNRLSDDF